MKWVVVLTVLLTACCVFAQDDESVCAKVVLDVKQDVTTERQAFDAYLKINNGYADVILEDVKVDVHFYDASNNLVEATSDESDEDALFFIRVSEMTNIDSIEGFGTVPHKSSAEIHWLIVPAPGSAGIDPNGTRYNIGGELRYRIGTDENSTVLMPDRIYVRPMPALFLDYFIPYQVYGDDPDTPTIENVIPFPMGLRVRNEGHGAAEAVRMVSAQPKIEANDQGLSIAFNVLECFVNGERVDDNNLQFDFGTIEPGEAGVAVTMLECMLSGKFTEMNAQFTHADDLGGRLTSLITDINSHLIMHPVMVDLDGRDGIVDFLVKEEDKSLMVYESDNIDSSVTNFSEVATLTLLSTNETEATYRLSVPGSLGPFYAGVPFSDSDDYEITSVTRMGDGSVFNPANIWFGKSRDQTEDWAETLNIFDTFGGGDYQVILGKEAEGVNHAPILQYIGNKQLMRTETLGFVVTAADPDIQDELILTCSSLPGNATFTVFTNSGLMKGTFRWVTEAVSEDTNITVEVTDGVLSDSETVSITFLAPPLDYPEWWALRGVLVTNANTITNDYAPIVMGQLKYFAAMAYDELTNLPGGADFELYLLTNENNYAAVNIGQVKEVASLFYDRLSMPYPWMDNTNAANDYAIANIGQVKGVFEDIEPYIDTDGDGMPDWYEEKYKNHPTFMDKDDPTDASEDPDGDNATNIHEYRNYTDPSVAF